MTLGTPTSGFTVWFTGMSASGKSTLAQGLANRLRRLGKMVDVLDGPEVEQMLGASPGPEFLMSLAVEHENASELVDLYCGEIVHALRQTSAATH